MGLNYHDLRYFLEVGHTLNLSRAAERLGISQPSLSLAIQRLEEEVGVGLLLRSQKGVQLAPAGKELLISAKLFLQQWDQLKREMLSKTEEVNGELHLGCHPSVAIYSLPKVLKQLLEDYPRLNFKLSHDLSRKVTEGVISSRLDLGIVVNPVRHPDLILRKLCDDLVTFWRSSQMNNKLHNVLICDPDLLQTQSLLKKAKKSQIQFERFLFSSNLEVVRELVESGAGVGILPTRIVSVSSRPRLERVKGGLTFKDEIYLIYRSENRRLKTIETFTKAIVDAFKSE